MTASWPLAKLGDHVDLLAGFAFKSQGFTENVDDVRLLRGANIGQGSLKWAHTKLWPRSSLADHTKFQLAVDDIVLAMDRPWIEAGLKWSVVRECDLPALLVQRVARLRATGSLSQDFLRFLVGSPQFAAYVRPIVTGVNVPHISPTQIRDFSFQLPPRRFQDSVTDLLLPLDDLIENNRRRIEVLEEMARLLYREWFVHFRFPGHEDVELVDSDVGPIPEGWNVRSFSDLAEFVNGFAFKPYHWLDEGLPIIKIKELKGGVTADTPRYHGADVDKKYFIENGAVLFSWSADLKAYVWAHGSALLNQHLFDVRPHEVSPLFIFHALNARMDHFQARAQGTTMKHIKRSALNEVRTAIPPVEVREEFETMVRPMLDLQLNLTAQNVVLREARDLLLPRLVSGELDVSELDLVLVEA